MSGCIPSRPIAKISIEAKGTDAVWLNNVSKYEDKGCRLSSRQARWIIFKNGRKVKDFGFLPTSTLIDLGTRYTSPDFTGSSNAGYQSQTVVSEPTQSNGNLVKLTDGPLSVWQYLTYTGVPLSNGDIIQIGVMVKNCKKQTSKMSNIYTLPPFGDCEDCCCEDDGYVFQVGNVDYCAITQVGNVDYCLV